jgi:DNA-binding transcriptional MocR family regulator
MSTSIGNAGADRNEQSLGAPHHLCLQIREMPSRCSERDMRVGDRLPSEKKLCDQFGVSRETSPGLESDGIISRMRPQETFVARRPRRAESRVWHLSHDFTRFKVDTKARVLGKGSLLPQPSVAKPGVMPPGKMISAAASCSANRSFYTRPCRPLVARARGGRCDLCSEPHRERAAALAAAADTAH